MLDIKFIRENPNLVKDCVKKRNLNMDDKIDEIIKKTRRI